jgi:iron(III) transport system ATP-binding protein
LERSEVTSNALAPRAVGVVVEQLRKEFGDKVALDGVDLSIEPGSFVVLLGPSGSGKTTLLRCVAGIERPSSGVITINDVCVAGPRTFVQPEKRKTAMVFQDYALWPHLTVRKNIAFPLATSSRSKERKDQRVDDLLERVGISHLAKRYPNELSGGEQQRVALARALAADVGLILFDEPLSNLDADRREQLRIEIATLTREAGATAIYITHDQSEAFALADRVGVLNYGSLVQFDTPENIYRHPKNAFVTRFTGVAGECAVLSASSLDDDYFDVTLPFAPSHSFKALGVDCHAGDSSLHFFVRASGITLNAPGDDDGVRAEVIDVAFNGRGYEHVVKVDDQMTLTKVFSVRRFERNANVKVSFDSSACFVMAAQGSRNT